MPHSVRFLRIDDRLIHGQVIVGWLPVLNSRTILVMNERVFNDPVRQDMMAMSLPPGVNLEVLSPEASKAHDGIPEDTLVLVASPRDAWTALQSGLEAQTLNVGGMHAKPGKTEILEALHLDDDDRRFFEMMLQAGLAPVFQPTPQNEPLPLSDIL